MQLLLQSGLQPTRLPGKQPCSSCCCLHVHEIHFNASVVCHQGWVLVNTCQDSGHCAPVVGTAIRHVVLKPCTRKQQQASSTSELSSKPDPYKAGPSPGSDIQHRNASPQRETRFPALLLASLLSEGLSWSFLHNLR